MSNRLYAFFLLLGLLVVIFISNPSLGLAQTPTPQAGGSSPSGGLPILPITLAAIGGALALVLLQTIGKQVANGVITWLHALVWNWLSGKPLFRIFNLNRYRNALRENNSKIKIPFRSEPIDMHNIYVPLKVEGADDRDQLDARGAVSLHRRMMIIGDPGSGKSIFMRYLALAYAENNLSDLEDRPIPVLLELHRLNDDRPIEEHLVEALDRNRFPNASVFVSRNLKDGRLMPLFDGFDEVNSSVRSRVAQDIIDFLSQYEKCRVVITSRPPAYNDEFAEQIPTKLQIVSFIDHQIRSFLSSWEPDMPEGKSVDQLMQTLDERPAIMSLARNPLMLTIIAYLYADTPYILPHSRVEFYSQSADVLLRQLNRTTPGDEALKYTPPEKRSVLQHLAASIQERSSQNNRDRSTLEYQIVVDEVGAVLSRLNRKPEDVLPLIEEIVNGSGLLLRIDGGQRYQFGHLTLQEFFAAEQLRDDPEGLVEKYKADGQTWRESLKLWCGLQRDNTPVVKAIYALDEMLGFECLADAHEVEPDTTNTIIDYFRSKLGQSDTDDAVARAFGILAMDDTPIGNETFTFLKSTLSDESEGSTRHLAAATALSLSNMPRGAEALAEHYELQGIRPFLVRMGGVSVSALVTLAKNGAHSALEDLKELGSPQAAEALTSLIWEESDTAHRAAWPLAELLADEEIANSLRRVSLSPDQCNAPGVSDYRWVWEPFETDEDASQDCPSLPTIASRLAYLISKGVESDLGYSINARLAVPLLAIEDYEESLKAASESGLSELGLQSDVAPDEIEEMLERTDVTLPVRRLMLAIYPGWLNILFERLRESDRKPDIADWRNVNRRLTYEFHRGWHYYLVLGISAGFTGLALAQIVWSLIDSFVVSNPWPWVYIASIPPIISVIGLFGWFDESFSLEAIELPVLRTLSGRNLRESASTYKFRPDVFLCAIIWGSIIYAVQSVILVFQDDRWIDRLWGPLLLLYLATPMVTVAIFASQFMLRFDLSFGAVGLVWLGAIAVGFALWRMGRREERRSRNPLQGILNSRIVSDNESSLQEQSFLSKKVER